MHRAELLEEIAGRYGVAAEYPWRRYPQYAVFRHAGNRKWFAVLMNLPGRKLGLATEEEVAILNVKIRAEENSLLRGMDGVLPALVATLTHHIADLSATQDNLADSLADVDLERIPLPFVQKTRTGGYDGKGVQVIVTEEDLPKLRDVPSVIETLCPIAHEIAVIVAADDDGKTVVYPVVEMIFDKVLNLVDYVQMPTFLNADIRKRAQALAVELVQAFGAAGLYAVEMFVTQSGEIWINETAPRVHNSGHLTIEACANSQFEQMWRLLAGMPLASVQQYRLAAMVNLIGAYGHSGPAVLEGLDEVLALDETFIHWYGKAETRPGRKMGHITVLADHEPALKAKIDKIRKAVRVVRYR